MKRRNKSSFGDSLGAATMRQSVPGRGQIIKLEQKAKMWNRFDKMQPSLLYVFLSSAGNDQFWTKSVEEMFVSPNI